MDIYTKNEVLCKLAADLNKRVHAMFCNNQDDGKESNKTDHVAGDPKVEDHAAGDHAAGDHAADHDKGDNNVKGNDAEDIADNEEVEEVKEVEEVEEVEEVLHNLNSNEPLLKDANYQQNPGSVEALLDEHAGKLTHNEKKAQVAFYALNKLWALNPTFIPEIDTMVLYDVNQTAKIWKAVASKHPVLQQLHQDTKNTTTNKTDLSDKMNDLRFVQLWLNENRRENADKLFTTMFKHTCTLLNACIAESPFLYGKNNADFNYIYKKMKDLMMATPSEPERLELVKTTAFVCAHFALNDMVYTKQKAEMAESYGKSYNLFIQLNVRIYNPDNQCRRLWYIRYAMLTQFLQFKDGQLKYRYRVDEKHEFPTNDQIDQLMRETTKDFGGGFISQTANIDDVLRRYARFVRLQAPTQSEPTLASFYWNVRYPEAIFQYRKKLLMNAAALHQFRDGATDSYDRALHQAFNDKQVLKQWTHRRDKASSANISNASFQSARSDNQEHYEHEFSSGKGKSRALIMLRLANVLQQSLPHTVPNVW